MRVKKEIMMAKKKIAGGKKKHSYVNPRFDVAFRKLFNAEDPDITISLLNAVLGFTGKQKIVSVEFADTTRPPAAAGLRTTVQDLICTDQRKNQYLVELQVSFQLYFPKRMLYYFSKMYSSQLVAGERFVDLKPAYAIGILDYNQFKHTERYHTVHKVFDADDKNMVQTFFDVEFHMIELPKFKKDISECKTLLDQWLYFFKHSDRILEIPPEISDKSLQKAFDKIDEFNWSAKERAEQEALLKAWRDHQEHELMVQETSFGKGLEQGEKNAKLEMAKKLLAAKMPIQNIAEITELSIDEIKKL